MITITESAKQELTTYFEGKEIVPLRIHLADGGCSGMRLSIALDEVRSGDRSIEDKGFTFVIQEELAEETGKVAIDMTQYGFTIDSEKMVGGGSGCGCSSNSGGGCGSGGCGC